ncbi:restriction modification system DNA specificity domain [Candidatus Vecturithrix granuli]|uniref:Restriction modification system DNA specificity domain n=1 Tax=Vecturithrix granuli TaxID=1499967 RepID=A0A081C5P1_VECG1|nr:restriction modification system DNA specificity domain [Candidatus Vecturithrix granuli]
MTGRSGSVGKVYYIEDDFWPHNTTLFVKDFKGNFPKYVYYFLLGFDITQYSASTAVPTLNRNNLRNIFVDVPPLEEQHEIVRRVEQLFALADSLEAKYHKAMQRVAKIEQALLAKAFLGELAPSDPHDESAEVLLQRILAEKSKLEAGKQTKKKQKSSPK